MLRSLLLWLFRKAELCVTVTDTSPYDAGSGPNPATGGQWLAAFTGWHHTHTWCWGPAAMHKFAPEPIGPYKLIETGSNGTKTTITVNSFKTDQPLSETLFTFDEARYKDLGYYIIRN